MEESNNNIVDNSNVQNVVVNNVTQPVNNQKKTPVGLIIGLIIGGIVFLGIIILVIVLLIGRSSSKEIQGTWKCNGNLGMKISGNELEMYSDTDSSTYIKANYTIKEFEIDNSYHKYTINASATKRVISGKEYTQPYTTQYQIVMEDGNKNELSMINTVSYSMYTCTRE